MKNNMRGTPQRYRNARPPAPKQNIPIVRTMDGAMSYIAKHRAFTAPKLHWEDRDTDGTLIAEATYNLVGKHVSNQGIVKGYLLHNYVMTEAYENEWAPDPLFYWDKLTDQWYRNAGNTESLDHPLEPCVPPDKSIIDLPLHELRFLMRTSVMDLMQAKVNGSLDSLSWVTRSTGSATGDYIVNPLFYGTTTGRSKS